MSELNPENDPRVQRIYGDEPIKVYNFFKEEFFGMERTLDKIVRYFHSAAMGGEECRQVLYLMGPVGSGKSSLVDRLIRGLEELPPIYAIDGDPMLGDPADLVPRHLRPAFEEMLGVKIEGDLNPVIRTDCSTSSAAATRRCRSAPCRSPSARGAASAWCRPWIRTIRTPRC